MKIILIIVTILIVPLALAQANSSMTSIELINEAAGTKTWKVHAKASRLLEDGGVETICYRTCSLTTRDGGVRDIDVGGSDCNLSAANRTAEKKILTDSATTGR